MQTFAPESEHSNRQIKSAQSLYECLDDSESKAQPKEINIDEIEESMVFALTRAHNQELATNPTKHT